MLGTATEGITMFRISDGCTENIVTAKLNSAVESKKHFLTLILSLMIKMENFILVVI